MAEQHLYRSGSAARVLAGRQLEGSSEVKTATRNALTCAMAGALLLVAGCVEDAPRKQTSADRNEMTGIATGGVTAGPGESVFEASVRGTAGRLRTSSSSAPSSQYAVSL